MADELTYWDYEGVLGGSGGVNYTIDDQGLPVFSQEFVPETDALVYSGQGFAGEGTTYFPSITPEDFGYAPQMSLAIAADGSLVDQNTGSLVKDSATFAKTEQAVADAAGIYQKAQTNQTLTPQDQSVWDNATKYLQQNAPKILTSLRIGALGIVIAKAVAGEPPTFEAPTPTAPLASVASARGALEQALTTTPGSVAASIRGVPTQAVFAYLTADQAGRTTLAPAYPGIAEAAVALSNGEGIQATGTARQDPPAAIRGGRAGPGKG